jgi:hypothetical protein
MEQDKLNEKLEELTEAIKNLANSRHNPSLQLKRYARDLFEQLIDEITH